MKVWFQLKEPTWIYSMARQDDSSRYPQFHHEAIMNLSTKGLGQALGKDRGATMRSQGTAPDTLELVMEKHPLGLKSRYRESRVISLVQ